MMTFLFYRQLWRTAKPWDRRAEGPDPPFFAFSSSVPLSRFAAIVLLESPAEEVNLDAFKHISWTSSISVFSFSSLFLLTSKYLSLALVFMTCQRRNLSLNIPLALFPCGIYIKLWTLHSIKALQLCILNPILSLWSKTFVFTNFEF